jgi:hypothetical protein
MKMRNNLEEKERERKINKLIMQGGLQMTVGARIHTTLCHRRLTPYLI